MPTSQPTPSQPPILLQSLANTSNSPQLSSPSVVVPATGANSSQNPPVVHARQMSIWHRQPLKAITSTGLATWLGLFTAAAALYVAVFYGVPMIKLAQWTAQKDYREACLEDQTRGIVSESCNVLLATPLPEPPLRARDLTRVTSQYIEIIRFLLPTNARGFSDSIWNSLATVVLCTLSTIPVIVPNGKSQPVHRVLKVVMSALSWGGFTLVAPEFILAIATTDAFHAWATHQNLCRQLSFRQHNWTITHIFFARAGGFAMRYSKFSHPTWSLLEVVDFAKCLDNRTRNSGDSVLRPLSMKEVMSLMQLGYIPHDCPVDESGILNRTKPNKLAFYLSFVQVVFFCLGLAFRVVVGLPITPLDLTVCTLCILSSLIYAISIGKPKSSEVIIELICFNGDIPEDALQVLDKHSSHERDGSVNHPIYSLVKTLGSESLVGYSISQYAVLTFVNVLLGCLYIAPWSLVFPRHADELLWKSASMASILSLIAVYVCTASSKAIESLGMSWRKSYNRMIVVIQTVAGLLYFCAKLVLLVAMFRSIFELPPDSYTMHVWTEYCPHV
ncbi:hypothetical protein B0O99DRAFT_712539 [Bisporella sp. PMI_857]|nr:hypothetical protein B0O99DRAFT_712539 [Bisporella sp. PMI_857]